MLTSCVPSWTLRMAAGSLQQWTITLTSLADDGAVIPYPIDGATWEYVASASVTGPQMFTVIPAATASGLITVTATDSLSQVLLEIYPAATVSLSGTYVHALWMNPGTPSALAVAEGPLQVAEIPQP